LTLSDNAMVSTGIGFLCCRMILSSDCARLKLIKHGDPLQSHALRFHHLAETHVAGLQVRLT